ncbi:hypothetical protein [Kineosporia sp. NBRC 101731]|uniref:hypothetical protein n=1 Tax=Kineosporia sp. NBRC 101731 TaxID=3032199 RepID=UPI0024A01B5E|nr:hypothetical protein [Kineosporia sp. NBRC 101731]GLY27399.1 hypothetical protein Kisp02_07640 [Kineosporia sp. NBRC 101731]
MAVEETQGCSRQIEVEDFTVNERDRLNGARPRGDEPLGLGNDPFRGPDAGTCWEISHGRAVYVCTGGPGTAIGRTEQHCPPVTRREDCIRQVAENFKAGKLVVS